MAEQQHDLDRFKRRLIRSVARLQAEKVDLWPAIEKIMGRDCQPLWQLMQSLTLKKLSRLLACEDFPERLAPVARMTPTDWLLLDLVLLHEEIDVIGASSAELDSKSLSELFKLVQMFELEERDSKTLVDGWAAATLHYNQKGRQCSPMLLQRRWYQLKALCRYCFYRFWEKGYRRRDSQPHPGDAPSALHVAMVCRYPHIVTEKLPSWVDLLDSGHVVLPHEFEKKMTSTKLPKPCETIEPDLVLIEPNIETIDLEQDTESDFDIDDDVKSNGDANNEVDPSKLEELPNLPTSSLNKENATDLNQGKLKMIKKETDCSDQAPEHLLEPDGLSNVKIIEATHISEEADKILDISDNDDTSDILIQNTGRLLDVEIEHSDSIVIPKGTELNAVESDLSGLAVDSNSVETLGNSNNLMHEETNNDTDSSNANYNKSEREDANIGVCPSLLGSDSTSSQICLDFELNLIDDGIEVIEDDDDVTHKPMEEPNEGSSEMRNFKSESDVSQSTEELTPVDEHDRIIKENEEEPLNNVDDPKTSLPKFDLKLLMVPVVYTKKLESMDVLPKHELTEGTINIKSIMNDIVMESKPIHFRGINIADQCLNVEESFDAEKELSNSQTVSEDAKQGEYLTRLTPEETLSDDTDDTSTVEHIAISSPLFQKPRFRTYSPISLCKNPDFNTRLHRHSVSFLMITRNRQQMNACKPLTVDVHKSFEDKLVDGTIFLKPSSNTLENQITDDNRSNVETPDVQRTSVTPSAMSAQSLFQGLSVDIEELLTNEPTLPVETTTPPLLEKDQVLEERKNKTIQLPDIDKVRQVNRHLLTAEVPPIQVNNLNDTKDFVQNIPREITYSVGPRGGIRRHTYARYQNVMMFSKSGEVKLGKVQIARLEAPKPRGQVKVPWFRRVSYGRYKEEEHLLTADALEKMIDFLSPTPKKKKIKIRAYKSVERYCCWYKRVKIREEMLKAGQKLRKRYHWCKSWADCTCCCRPLTENDTNPSDKTSEDVDKVDLHKEQDNVNCEDNLELACPEEMITEITNAIACIEGTSEDSSQILEPVNSSSTMVLGTTPSFLTTYNNEISPVNEKPLESSDINDIETVPPVDVLCENNTVISTINVDELECATTVSKTTSEEEIVSNIVVNSEDDSSCCALDQKEDDVLLIGDCNTSDHNIELNTVENKNNEDVNEGKNDTAITVAETVDLVESDDELSYENTVEIESTLGKRKRKYVRKNKETKKMSKKEKEAINMYEEWLKLKKLSKTAFGFSAEPKPRPQVINKNASLEQLPDHTYTQEPPVVKIHSKNGAISIDATSDSCLNSVPDLSYVQQTFIVRPSDGNSVPISLGKNKILVTSADIRIDQSLLVAPAHCDQPEIIDLNDEDVSNENALTNKVSQVNAIGEKSNVSIPQADLPQGVRVTVMPNGQVTAVIDDEAGELSEHQMDILKNLITVTQQQIDMNFTKNIVMATEVQPTLEITSDDNMEVSKCSNSDPTYNNHDADIVKGNLSNPSAISVNADSEFAANAITEHSYQIAHSSICAGVGQEPFTAISSPNTVNEVVLIVNNQDNEALGCGNLKSSTLCQNNQKQPDNTDITRVDIQPSCLENESAKSLKETCTDEITDQCKILDVDVQENDNNLNLLRSKTGNKYLKVKKFATIQESVDDTPEVKEAEIEKPSLGGGHKNSNSILSDLMQISGITTDDATGLDQVPEPTKTLSDDLIRTAILASNTTMANNANTVTVLTPVTSLIELQLANLRCGQFFMLNCATGHVQPLKVVKVSPISKDSTSPSNLKYIEIAPKPNCQQKVLFPMSDEIIDLDDNNVEILPTATSIDFAGINPSVLKPCYKHGIDKKSTPSILIKRANLSTEFARKNNKQETLCKILGRLRNRRRKTLETRINLIDSDTPMEEEYLVESDIELVEENPNDGCSGNEQLCGTPVLKKRGSKLKRIRKIKELDVAFYSSDEEPLAKKVSHKPATCVQDVKTNSNQSLEVPGSETREMIDDQRVVNEVPCEVKDTIAKDTSELLSKDSAAESSEVQTLDPNDAVEIDNDSSRDSECILGM